MITSTHNKYDSKYIPEEVSDYIHHWETSELLYNIVFERYKISEEQARKITEIIWEIYFKRIPYTNLNNELLKIISEKETLNQILNTLNKELFPPIHTYLIGKNDPKQLQAIEKITLNNAINNYPEIGEQLVTSNHIKLKNFPEPVRPSINNWLSDYTFSLGFESHSAMDRGTYLFRNENAKGLNSIDREKISYILKAYDENSPVEVNINTKQIVFPKREQANINTTFNGGSTSKREVEPPREFHSQTSQRNNFQEIYNARPQKNQPKDIFEKERTATQDRNASNLNFSSPQKLPYEKQTIQPAQQPQKTVISPQPMRISSQNLRNTNVPPGNIVNLKDQ